MQRITRDKLTPVFDRRLAPVGRVSPGEVFVVETEDSRGGRTRKKKTSTATTASAPENGAGEPDQIEQPIARIRLPDATLGTEPAEAAPAEPAADGDTPKPKKKTRRGTRGGRNRKKRTAAVGAAENGADAAVAEPQPVEVEPSNPTWDYVPMSEWADEIDSSR